jgi:sulfatase modifying factor 1
MPRMQFISVAALAAVTGLASSIALASINIPTVPIGNLGNAPDPFTGSLYGAVAYSYNIGSTEVTNTQYVAFLNAVAKTDTNNLYNTEMAGTFGGITRSGSAGSYTYSTVSGRANHPVNFVSFWDATRFANWLHNGQPTGVQNASTTENGAYTLTPAGISANTVTRNTGWQWAVTSEDEWYKTAYHQPASAGGDSDNYWLFPTSSNALRTVDANMSNVNRNTRSVGSYRANFYGTFDMAGNVWEWNDTIIDSSSRGMRGASFYDNDFSMRSTFRGSGVPSDEFAVVGFRVSQVPGPSSIALLALSGALALRRRRVIGG